MANDLVPRRAVEADWHLVRGVRLAALAESPGAFGSTLAVEREYDADDWRAWCRDSATFLALRDGTAIGMAAGLAGTSPGERRLVAMWVRPSHRGTGIATALLDGVRSWADADGATTLTLWVVRTNRRAATFYRRAGFTATGTSRPLPSAADLVEDELALAVVQRT